MSTRTMLRFVGGDTDSKNDTIAQVYNHSDGYPSNIIGTLSDLYDLLDATGTFRGPGYTAAQYILFYKMSLLQMYTEDSSHRDSLTQSEVIDPDAWKKLGQPAFLLGHAVYDPADQLPGDLEYVYIVDVGEDFNRLTEWDVTVSEHDGYPSSRPVREGGETNWVWPDDFDPETDDQWDHLEVDFHGPLSDAYDKYVDDD